MAKKKLTTENLMEPEPGAETEGAAPEPEAPIDALVSIRAKVSFAVMVNKSFRPLQQGEVIRVPAAIAAQQVNAGLAEYTE